MKKKMEYKKIEISVSVKFFVFCTVALSFVFYLISLIYGIPIVYIPDNISTIEFVSYHVVGIVFETTLALFLFMHMLVKSKMDFHTYG
ncbi:hypothetical protein A9Q76_03775 [Arcobacter sp. 31_11_sub10_T18]|nr:hypothetical protein A9Q76_03775 [Arcobacter sp. 31_11_sub10_T18]